MNRVESTSTPIATTHSSTNSQTATHPNLHTHLPTQVLDGKRKYASTSNNPNKFQRLNSQGEKAAVVTDLNSQAARLQDQIEELTNQIREVEMRDNLEHLDERQMLVQKLEALYAAITKPGALEIAPEQTYDYLRTILQYWLKNQTVAITQMVYQAHPDLQLAAVRKEALTAELAQLTEREQKFQADNDVNSAQAIIQIRARQQAIREELGRPEYNRSVEVYFNDEGIVEGFQVL